VQLLAGELERHYVDPDTAKKLGKVLRAKDRSGAYHSIITPPEFAQALNRDLAAVAHDPHLRVNYVPGPPPKDEQVSPTEHIPAALADTLRDLNGMIPKVQVLEGNVGYIRVDGLAPLSISRAPIAAAFAFLRNSTALIVDCRSNTGGDPETVGFIVSYLSGGSSYVINSVSDRAGRAVREYRTTNLGALSFGPTKPVFVLTSPITFSAGEMLAYDLQAFGRASIVGEVTAGGGNGGGTAFKLGHDLFALIPEVRILNPVTRSSWEGIGVKPDESVSAAAALIRAHQLAIERLLLTAVNPARRAILEAVDAKLQVLTEARSGGPQLRIDQLTGTYTLVDGTFPGGGAASGPTVTIAERNGALVQEIEGVGEAMLIRVSGNRFIPQGSPDGNYTSFLIKNGRLQMVMEDPPGPPALRIKR